jgi:hypothetical protein
VGINMSEQYGMHHHHIRNHPNQVIVGYNASILRLTATLKVLYSATQCISPHVPHVKCLEDNSFWYRCFHNSTILPYLPLQFPSLCGWPELGHVLNRSSDRPKSAYELLSAMVVCTGLPRPWHCVSPIEWSESVTIAATIHQAQYGQTKDTRGVNNIMWASVKSLGGGTVCKSDIGSIDPMVFDAWWEIFVYTNWGLLKFTTICILSFYCIV